MDEYKIYYETGDLRFVGHLTDVRRKTKGGEIEIVLLSPILHLNRIRPFFPTDTASYESHPASADISYWAKALLDEWVVPEGDLSYSAGDIPNTGTSVEMPILDGRYTVAEIFDTWALMAGNRGWGVDHQNNVYFKPSSTAVQAKYHVGVDRGWGKVASLTDHFGLNDVVNSLQVIGDAPAYLDEQGRVRYSAQSAVFLQTFEDASSISEHGRRRRDLHLPTVRTQAQAQAAADTFLSLLAAPQHRFELNVSNVADDLAPEDGTIVAYNESATKIGTFAVESVVFSFEEDAKASMKLGAWDLPGSFCVAPHSPSDRLCAFPKAFPASERNENISDSATNHFPNWRLAEVTVVNGDGTYDLKEVENEGNVFESLSVNGGVSVLLAVGDQVFVSVPTEDGMANDRNIEIVTSPLPVEREVTDGTDRGPLSDLFGFDDSGNLCIRETARILLSGGSSETLADYVST